MSGDAEWRQDSQGLWWKGDTDGPYNKDWKKIPFTVAEILPIILDFAKKCNTAALSTITEVGPSGAIFPRSRTVSPRHYINDSFTEVSMATKIFTRKCEEIRKRPEASLLWKDDDGKIGGWVLAIGRAEVVPDPNVGKGPDVDGHDKAKILLRVERLEIQDYTTGILGDGVDTWKPAILELQNGAWTKIQ